MATIHYLENQFLNATFGTSKLMHMVIFDHYGKLVEGALDDPNLVPVRDRTLPFLTDLQNARAGFLGAKGTREATTLAFENKLKELSMPKIRDWDIQIQGVYADDSSEYRDLLTNGRGPFQKGGYEERMTALLDLRDKLAGYPLLAATLADVTAFYTAILALRTAQTQKEQRLALASDRMELARLGAAKICYRNLAWLIDYLIDNLEEVDNYYEFNLIMTTGSAPEEGTGYEGTVDPATTIEVAARDFSVVTLVRLKNTGTATLTFCRGDVSAITCTSPSKELAPGESLDVTPDDLGSGQFLNVTNNEPAIAGAWEVVVF